MKSPSRWVLLLFLTFGNCVLAQDYDLVLRNGLIVDGTGNPGFHADLAIREGRIVALGSIRGAGKAEFDIRGLVVAPGFIDVHTHAEGIEKQPLAENFLRMGVTTLVLGNCGSSRVDVGAYFAQLENATISPNVATLIGHGGVRRKAMAGSFQRAPTDEELAAMKDLVEQAMQDGAVGMSTGLIYVPGSFARTDEIIQLAKIVSDYGGIYVSHMRNEGANIFSALDELFRIAREARIPSQISHIKLSGKSMWGRAEEVLRRIEQARATGLDITQDQYMYPASSTGIQSRIPTWAREGGDTDFVQRINDPELKRRIIREMKENLARTGHEDFGFAVIASYAKDTSLNGLNMVDAAQKLRASTSLDDQIEAILELAANGGASCVFHSMSEEDLQAFLKHPNTMVASDSAVREFGAGNPHPRGYGNTARLLVRYVRELKLLRLEDAVRRATSLPAAAFRLQNRGQLREGAWADLVVFDPRAVQDNATFDKPHRYATGFKFVFVNGVAVIEDDRHTGRRPGMIIRHQGSR